MNLVLAANEEAAWDSRQSSLVSDMRDVLFWVQEHFSAASARVESKEEKFARLSQVWRRDVGGRSTLAHIAMHPAYQEIIGMGSQAVPLILQAMKERREHWFWALRAITGVDPVPGDDRGRIKKMTEAWLQWGRAKNYLT